MGYVRNLNTHVWGAKSAETRLCFVTPSAVRLLRKVGFAREGREKHRDRHDSASLRLRQSLCFRSCSCGFLILRLISCNDDLQLLLLSHTSELLLGFEPLHNDFAPSISQACGAI